MLFDQITRTDATPSRFTETRFQFLNRSASSYFATVRDLIEDWLSNVPLEHRQDLIGRLRKDNASHRSAFWELYLHEGYRRSGYGIEIHPAVPDSVNHPDFRIQGPEAAFYLEAVRVGVRSAKIAADRRLDAVHQVLSDLQVQDFLLFLETNRIGPAPLATKRLRSDLVQWVATLDADEVAAAIADPGRGVGLRVLPQVRWKDQGWDLTFSAGPVVPEGRGVDRGALGVMGSGGGAVDNVTGLRRVLAKKHGRYGDLDLPLVVAIESDTEVPTREYDIDRVLYGLAALRPDNPRREPSHLAEEGFWFGRSGWQRSATPQVITSAGIAPWSVATRPALVWTTLEPEVPAPTQPSWLSSVIVGQEAVPTTGTAPGAHFGLDPAWVSSSPDFSES